MCICARVTAVTALFSVSSADLRLRFLKLHRKLRPPLPRVTFLYKATSRARAAPPVVAPVVPHSAFTHSGDWGLGSCRGGGNRALSLRLFLLRLHFYSFSRTPSPSPKISPGIAMKLGDYAHVAGVHPAWSDTLSLRCCTYCIVIY